MLIVPAISSVGNKSFALMQKSKNNKLHNFRAIRQSGFTLIELLVVISIMSLLASVLLVAVNNAREKAKLTVTVANVRQLQKALEIYINDVGFYPPDVNRAWDPGLGKTLPYDLSGTGQDCNTNLPACVCNNYLPCIALPPGIPANWIVVALSSWRGPYLSRWPSTTPWGGAYDYNYWDTMTVRNGCNVPPGIYLGLESGNGFSLNPTVEQQLFSQGLDNDGCSNNGEAQILLVPL